MNSPLARLFLAVVLASAFRPAQAAPYGKPLPNPTPGDKIFAEYFRAETRAVTDRTLADVQSLADWNARKAQFR